MRVHHIIGEKLNTSVTFKYLEDSEGDDNRGWQVDEINAYMGETKVGYLKLAYIPAERFKKWYPSILSYIQLIGGSHFFPRQYCTVPWTSIPIDDLRKSVYMMAQVAGVGWNESNRMQAEASEAPDKIVRQMIHGLVMEIEKEQGHKFKAFKKFFVNHPYVDFIRVDDEYKRMGIGTALYRAGHEWMKTKGMKLHASNSQSADAAAAWETLERDYPVEKVRMKNPSGRGMATRRRFAD